MRKYIDLFEAKRKGIDITKKNLTEIPPEYKGIKVNGDFSCFFNELTSLKNSPASVSGGFLCMYNKLTTLLGGPVTVDGEYDCRYNNLANLIGASVVVNSYFTCQNNDITSLEGVPQIIRGEFYCNGNNLTPWGMRHILFTELHGEFRSDNNNVNELINNFMKLTQEEKQKQVPYYLEELKAMS